MCRLMGYVSKDVTTFSEISGPNFLEFANLSKVHNDGWGIATVNEATASSVIVEPSPAIESAKFQESAEHLKADAALLHFRWATAGLEVKEENTHPFSYNEYSFIHNGGVMPKESLDPLYDHSRFTLRGDTDSERYFFVLMTNILKSGLKQGLLDGVRQIRENCTFSSLNAMLLTPTHYAVISEHDNSKIPSQFPADYYELYYRRDSHGVLVASSGWDQSDWSPLPNHRLLIANRESLAIDIEEI